MHCVLFGDCTACAACARACLQLLYRERRKERAAVLQWFPFGSFVVTEAAMASSGSNS
jgi:predicted nucleic acid-binding Zn ribbon protein